MNTLEKEFEIEPIITGSVTSSLNYISISIEHDKGGHSWYTGEIRDTGIIFRIKPFGRHNGTCRTIIDGKKEHMGFYVFLTPCARKSPKKMQVIADKIFPYGQEIVNLFLEGKYTEIANKVITLANS
jgi:hypothetical protein